MRYSRFMRREFISSSILGVGGVAFLVSYSSQAFFSENLSKFFTPRGRDGEPVPVRANVKILVEQALSDFNFTEWNKNFFNPFICKGLDPFIIGSTKVKDGVYLGVPQYFQAANEDEIIESNLNIQKKPLEWSSGDGERLLRSLQLSDNAIKFILAKQILLADTYKCVIDAFLPSFIAAGYYAVCERIHVFFKLMEKPLISSLFTHAAIGIVFVIIYLFLKDGIQFSYEKSVEDQIYKSTEVYIRGGIEYYQKIIERNKALRNLTKNGERRFSIAGNEISLLRSKGLPITFKLKVAQESLEKYYLKQEVMTPPTPRKPQPIF